MLKLMVVGRRRWIWVQFTWLMSEYACQASVTTTETKDRNTAQRLIPPFCQDWTRVGRVCEPNKPSGDDSGLSKLILGGSTPSFIAKIIFMIPGIPAAVSKWPRLTSQSQSVAVRTIQFVSKKCPLRLTQPCHHMYRLRDTQSLQCCLVLDLMPVSAFKALLVLCYLGLIRTGHGHRSTSQYRWRLRRCCRHHALHQLSVLGLNTRTFASKQTLLLLSNGTDTPWSG